MLKTIRLTPKSKAKITIVGWILTPFMRIYSKGGRNRNFPRLSGIYFREPLYPLRFRAFPPSLSTRSLSLLAKLPWRHVCRTTCPNVSCLSFPWWSPTKPASVDHSILVHRLFLSFFPTFVSRASMHYKYLQISRVPYSIDHVEERRGGRAKDDDKTRHAGWWLHAGATERRGLLLGRCLRRLYGGTVCVHTRPVPVTEYACRCMATTTWPHDPMIFFLSAIWFNGDSWTANSGMNNSVRLVRRWNRRTLPLAGWLAAFDHSVLALAC